MPVSGVEPAMPYLAADVSRTLMMASRLRKLISENKLPPEEHERQERAAIRLKERLSTTPSFRNRAIAGDMNFWRNYQSSRALKD